MNQLEYLPGIAGQSVQLDGPSAFVGIAEEMRSREWDYDLGYRDLVAATRPARTVDVTFHADYDTADTLRRVADADVMARTPGTFVAQKEWKQRGYILASDVDDIHYGRLSTGLKIALLDGAWWRLVKRSFVPEITTPEYRSATGETVTASGASGAPLHVLTVDGRAVQNGTPTPSAPVDVQVVQGINLLTGAVSIDKRGITFTRNNDGSVVANGTATGAAQYKIDFTADFDGNCTFSGCPEGGSVSTSYDVYMWDLDANARAKKWDGTSSNTSDTGNGSEVKIQKGTRYRLVCRISSGYTANNVTFKPMLAEGSYAAPYIPYGSIGLNINGTITPINLNGNVLASLPDGTKDVLTVDSAGHCVLNKRIAFFEYDGSSDETWVSKNTMQSGKYSYIANAPGLPDATSIAGTTNTGWTLCDRFPYASDSQTYNCNVGVSVRRTNTQQVIFYHEGEALADFKTWLASNPVSLYYKLGATQTIDLGYIDMPAVPFEAQISVTAAVTPVITAEWQISRDAYLDYPHNYEYDFQKTSSTGRITPSVLTPSDVYLAIFGPAVNPYVIVGGNRYQVNVTVPSGGYLVVDGRDKTIMLTLADGTVQNVFSSGVRGGGSGGGTYIFEKIPAGTSEVTYDGSFGFDLGWYEEEGEPPWNQS